MGETSAKGMENRTIQFTESLFIFNSTFSNLVCISVSTLRSRIGHGWMCNFEPKQTVPNIAAAWPRLGAVEASSEACPMEWTVWTRRRCDDSCVTRGKVL